MVKRKIIRIDEDLCNGCGNCVSPCAEGAIEIVNGKARLISEELCDGVQVFVLGYALRVPCKLRNERLFPSMKSPSMNIWRKLKSDVRKLP